MLRISWRGYLAFCIYIQTLMLSQEISIKLMDWLRVLTNSLDVRWLFTWHITHVSRILFVMKVTTVWQWRAKNYEVSFLILEVIVVINMAAAIRSRLKDLRTIICWEGLQCVHAWSSIWPSANSDIYWYLVWEKRSQESGCGDMMLCMRQRPACQSWTSKLWAARAGRGLNCIAQDCTLQGTQRPPPPYELLQSLMRGKKWSANQPSK